MKPRVNPLTVRLKDGEKQLIQDAADKLGMTRNAFVRFATWMYVNKLVIEGKLPSKFARF